MSHDDAVSWVYLFLEIVEIGAIVLASQLPQWAPATMVMNIFWPIYFIFGISLFFDAVVILVY